MKEQKQLHHKDENNEFAVLNQDDLLKILPFGKTKLQMLLQANVLPAVKIGRDYVTTKKQLQDWFNKYEGKEVFY